MYVPVGSGTDYFGLHIGVRGRAAYSVPFDVMYGVFKPGLFTAAASCTRTGTWSSSPQTATRSGTHYFSDTAGSKISATVTGSVLAIEQYQSTNGGYAVVTVDGSDAFASPLPVFTTDDYNNSLCRLSDVGKHYICGYLAWAWSSTQVLATGLSTGAHTLEIEVCGTKPAASSNVRVYVEALIGCGPNDTVGSANTHMVPIKRFCENYSTGGVANHTVMMYAPSGSADWQFMTGIHSDNAVCKEESVSGPTIYVDATDRSAAATGTYYSGTIITWYQESRASHRANFATWVLNKKRLLTFAAGRLYPVMFEVTHKWLSEGTVQTSYPVMTSIAAYDYQRRTLMPTQTQDKMWLGSHAQTNFSANDSSATPVCGSQSVHRSALPPTLLNCFPDSLFWGSLLDEQPHRAQLYAAAGRYVFSDRTDGTDKGYIADAYVARRPVAVDEVDRYVFGFGAAMRSALPA